MNIKEALQLKIQGIIDLDNCIFINRFTDQDIENLKVIIEKEGIKCKILDFSKCLVAGSRETLETTAIRYIYTIQRYTDIIMHSNRLFLIKDIYLFYNNYITEFLRKTNPAFLCWYLSYNTSCHPIMILDTSTNANNYGLINITTKDILNGYQRGLKELENLISIK